MDTQAGQVRQQRPGFRLAQGLQDGGAGEQQRFGVVLIFSSEHQVFPGVVARLIKPLECAGLFLAQEQKTGFCGVGSADKRIVAPQVALREPVAPTDGQRGRVGRLRTAFAGVFGAKPAQKAVVFGARAADAKAVLGQVAEQPGKGAQVGAHHFPKRLRGQCAGAVAVPHGAGAKGIGEYFQDLRGYAGVLVALEADGAIVEWVGHAYVKVFVKGQRSKDNFAPD